MWDWEEKRTIMTTIYDIAKRAGVSVATVSKVFNNYDEVSQKTKTKVLEVADSMGYVPNLSARSLKTNKSYLVGIIFSEEIGIGLEHQFFSSVLEAFRKKIGEFGYDTVFISKTLGGRELGYLDHAKYRNVDGILIITALPNDVNMNKVLTSYIPCVTTDIKYDKTEQVSSDNRRAGVEVVDYLVEMGHSRIAHISGPLDTLASLERRAGYLNGLIKYNIPKRDSYMIESTSYHYKQAYLAAHKLLSRFQHSELPTAIFTDSDVIAVATMKAIVAQGLRVPEDISVIGFDDVEFARYVTPELTTISQNKKLLGETLARLLNDKMNKKPLDKEIYLVKTDIIERASVRRIH